ncbi:sulfatase-like hydrolase/transferase, partial [Phascolarctobacterium succinatutens]
MSLYIIAGICLYIASYAFYVTFSHGLGHKAEYLQLRRFIPCAILAVLPMYLVNESLLSPQYLLSFLVGVSWITAYPLFYYLTYHKISSDFGFHLDTVFGLYIIGWLISLKLLVQALNIFPAITLSLISIMEYMLLALPLFQASYYLLYGTCVSTGAVTMIFETYTNEVIEYFKSMPLAVRIGTPILNIALLAGFLYFNLTSETVITAPLLPNLAIIIAVTLFLTYYLWNTKKGVFIRTGLIELVLDVKDYLKQTKSYKTNLAKRVANLNVTQTTPFCEKPATFILVIGESESRDYMSAFCDYPYDTTPWLKSKQASENFLLYKNAYACKDQTVLALERAFTEVNQYNDKKFYESCSFVDIARKAGFKISWFSNQSHIGAADTAVTLVANTADTAEWTKLHLNQVQYDESLLGYLKQIDA